MTSKENFNKVISDWVNDRQWVFGVPNIFLKKHYYVYNDPTVQGEYLFVFEIVDNTHFVDDKLDSYSSSKHFRTSGFSNDKVNPKEDVDRLVKELKTFTQDSIKEYEERLNEYKLQGKQILTTNPIEW